MPPHGGQFKNGRVITDYSRLAESLRTIQDWPSPYGQFKVGRVLTHYSKLALPSQTPSSTPRQYASFISTSPIILGLSDLT